MALGIPPTSGRRARAPLVVLSLVTALLVVATVTLDLPRASRGELWGDAATYHGMAWSLARDLDLRFDAGDLARSREEYPGGPQGVFLKRASGGLTVDGAGGFPWVRRVRPDEARLYYAKAFVHPLVAAPLVAVLGTRGLLLTNGLLLSVALWLAFALLRRRGLAPWPAVAVASGLFLLTVVPLYLVWPTPEILGLALIAAAFAAWAAGRPLLAAALFGVAGYMKPPNVLLAAPLGLEPLLPAAGGRLLGPDARRRLGESLRRGAVLALVSASLYGLNTAATGELNYQGGERKTFYGRFPFDETGATFDDSGTWMTTNRVGPLVAGRDEEKVTAQSGPARNPAEIRESFVWNLPYFWVGRFGGALAYFFPAVAAALLFLLRGPRDRAGWLALVAIVLSWIAYVGIIPDNWYGGGGTVGNRYFLNLLPAFLFLVPARRAWAIAAGALVAAAVFLAPLLASPVHHSLRPGDHATRGAFRYLPAELTMLNDLSVFTETWRKKRPFGFVGNPQRPADPDAYFLYFMDDGTFGKEEWAGRAGFWLRGRRRGGGGAAGVRPRARRARRPACHGGTAGRRGDGPARLGLAFRAGERGARRVARDRASGGPGPAVLRHVPAHPAPALAPGRAAARRPPGRGVRRRAARDGPPVRGAMSERVARVVLGVVAGLALVAAVVVDLPRASDGRFWSDGATYHAMAGSLAFDHDLDFGPADLARVRAAYPSGPQGVFLKRVGGSGGERLAYAKALAYPAAAAPLVRVLGVDRGLLVLNALLFGAALWAGYAELRRSTGAGRAAAGALAVVAGGVVPVFLLWETPEIFNLAVVTLGLVAWRRGWPLASAVLLGLAAYSKPTNLALALPILLEPLLGGRAAPAWGSRLVEAGRRGAVVAAVVAAGFGLTWLATGEANYQGGERKTFYDVYPFDPGVTFDTSGVWMTTDHLGPLVAGRDEDKQTERIAPARAAEELRQSFRLNLGYFWAGRFGGALPYFPGVVLAAVLFVLLGPRERQGWLALVALIVSWLGYILVIPDNWYGGAGTIGNRYFVSLVPVGLFLLPRGRGAIAAAGTAIVTGSLLLPVLASPVRHSLQPGAHALRGTFRVLPPELTMLGDLSVFTDVWRKRRPYNAPGGDPSRRPPGAPPSFFLWFLDDGTYGQESSFGKEGFWLKGGASADVVLQSLAPPARVRLAVTAGPGGDIVTARLGRNRQRLVLAPLRSGEIVFESPSAGLGYYGTRVHLLRLGSRYGGTTDRDGRTLGSFVYVELGEGK